MNKKQILKIANNLLPKQKQKQKISSIYNSLENVTSLADAQKIIKEKGITSDWLDNVYNQHANNPLVSLACNMLGVNPQDLKTQADSLLNSDKPVSISKAKKKYPRLS